MDKASDDCGDKGEKGRAVPLGCRRGEVDEDGKEGGMTLGDYLRGLSLVVKMVVLLGADGLYFSTLQKRLFIPVISSRGNPRYLIFV